MAELLDDTALHAGLAERSHWSLRDGMLTRAVQAPAFLVGITLVTEVAKAAEETQHHPDIDIRYTTVTFGLTTHDAGGITENDMAMAGRIDELVDQIVAEG